MEDYIKQCKHCNTLFRTDSKRVVYCSKKCADEVIAAHLHEYAVYKSKEKYKDIPDIPTCKICGFQAPRLTSHIKRIHGYKDSYYKRKYKARRKDIYHPSYIEAVTTLNKTKTKTCKVCEEEFEQKTTRQDCCSKACSADLHRITSKIRMRTYSKKIRDGVPVNQPKTQKCKQCGTEFTHNHEYQLFCKVKCRNKWFNDKKKEGKPKRKGNCMACGKEYEMKRNERSCSKKCRDKLSRMFVLKEKIEKSIEKYKDDPDVPTCKVCGFRGQRLHSHIKRIHKLTVKQYCEKYNVHKHDLTYAPLIERSREIGKQVSKRMYEDWLKTHKQSSTI